jgi:hypothetical protein
MVHWQRWPSPGYWLHQPVRPAGPEAIVTFLCRHARAFFVLVAILIILASLALLVATVKAAP